ncbi:LysR substrate-binding domain-containing protein [Polaromonas sp. P1(28)-13]|nr:LysR substrate-binding domain-containing protein [Polaromonas sp. P1(28)-13]
MPRFQAQHPDLDIEMRQFRHDEDFSRDDVDVWIDVKRPRRRWPTRLQVSYLLGRDIVPVCAPAVLPRLKQPRDLAREVLLYHTNFPDNWARWANIAGLGGEPRLGPGYDLSMNLIFAAKEGLGIAITQPLPDRTRVAERRTCHPLCLAGIDRARIFPVHRQGPPDQPRPAGLHAVGAGGGPAGGRSGVGRIERAGPGCSRRRFAVATCWLD